ncbi:endonuclease IV related protein [Thermoplasma acidophilum]|uniref:Probable endonuclease 4 n=1 Tax=Thermoplasma acidophilum (strain ATCC 25905 / DSM 1728 / JCM 9062 / NBRC 15155 / AMRC-C165) TaxID=273075 RepID=END4_THEAC|nr:deoxyribonuclease IV [Thermoplasma acidophilum]Q9HJS3.1 RecName: Full=Probable endonuclease 4; AltName: Full=Endodeoxyribonuclease IV; AltName: Full=Endonuclease IV [Thermoplasma acidophilum DSM 1728]CAC12020.1 endonuclease IV related protein [Thermoplasma acidophilum]
MIDEAIRSISKKYTIGGHISVAGGLHNGPARAAVFGFPTFQFFSKNQMRWSSPPLKDDEAAAFKSEVRKYGIESTMIHASYLINLASADPDLYKRSMEAFHDEIDRSDKLGSTFLTVHPGSNPDRADGIRRVRDALSTIGDHAVIILIENTAGQGNVIGTRLDEVAKIIDTSDKKLGVCIDTCHAWASGYDLRDSLEKFIESLDYTIGLDRIFAFHLNDAKREMGSRIDRHELIGKGTIDGGLINLIRDDRLRAKPKIMETPFGEARFEDNLRYMSSKIGE